MHELYNRKGILENADIERLYEQNFEMSYNVPKYVIAKKRAAGLQALKRYYQEKREWFDLVLWLERDFEYYLSGAVIRGRIDLLKRVNQAGEEIVDFKTGEPHDFLRTELQMQIYSLAAVEQLRQDIRSATLHYIEINEDKSFEVSKDWLDAGKQELSKAIEGIKNRMFVATPGEACTRCEVRKVCRYAIQ
jgi:CRISPR/Cas system-associated exonuclease Cas4 (RecB family)